MSTKNKFILFVIIICLITLLVGGYTYKGNDVSAIENNIEVDNYVSVWTTKDIEIKNEPYIYGTNIGIYYWNTKIPVTYINDDWAKIKGIEQYVHRDFLSEAPITYKDCDVPSNNTIKSYMDYRSITLETSDQYKLQQSSAYTNNYGLRMVGDRYCMAVGSYYTTTIGQYMDIELENGEIIKAILADCKDDKHTDSTNRINPNGSVIEFIVDTDCLDYTPKMMGDISYVNNWNSKVVNIRVYDKIEEFK